MIQLPFRTVMVSQTRTVSLTLPCSMGRRVQPSMRCSPGWSSAAPAHLLSSKAATAVMIARSRANGRNDLFMADSPGGLWPTLPRRSLWMPQPGGSERRHRQLHRLSLVIGPRGAQVVARALRVLADVLGSCRREAIVLVLVRGNDDGGVGHVCCLLLGGVSAGRVRATCRSVARRAAGAAPHARTH